MPETVLSVAVFVGEPEEHGADLVQLYEREEGTVRGRDAVLLRDGEPVARVADLPWEGEDPDHWQNGARTATASCSPAGSGRTTCARRSQPCSRGRWTQRRSSSPRPAIKDHEKVRAFVRGGAA